MESYTDQAPERADFWTPILTAIAIACGISALFLAFAAILALQGIYNIFDSFDSSPTKIIFVIGVFCSLILQVSVERFINANKLIQGFSTKKTKWLEGFGLFTSILLICVAISSILFINFFWFHVGITVFYSFLLLVVDSYFYIETEKAKSLVENSNNFRLKVCNIVCGSVCTKVDLGVFFGLSTSAFLAYLLENKYNMQKKLDSLAGYHNETHSNPLNDHDQGWISFLENRSDGPSFLDNLQHVSYELPALLFSGAVGVQLIISVIVLWYLLHDWTAKLDGEISRIGDKQRKVVDDMAPATPVSRKKADK